MSAQKPGRQEKVKKGKEKKEKSGKRTWIDAPKPRVFKKKRKRVENTLWL
jgi:hypothetical protein